MGDRQKARTRSALRTAFRIGEFSIEPQEGSITGPADRVHVDPKVMDVLVVLAKKASNVVSRSELLEEVWPGRIVSDDALSRCIYQLRRSLCQAGGDNAYRMIIETIPKRGYRLNCESPLEAREITPAETTGAGSRAGTDRSRFTLPRVAGLLAIIVAVAGAGLWFSIRGGSHESPATHKEAYDYFERGNEYYSRPDHLVALPYAEELYQQAIRLDPAFTLAWEALAKTNTDMYWYGIDRTPARLEKAQAAVQRLFALDPELPEAHLANARFLFKCLNRYEDALAELRLAEKSIHRNPELFFLRAMIYRRLGNWRAAIDSLDTAIGLESANILFLRQQYLNYLFTRQFEPAEQVLDHILELFPDNGTAYVDKVVLALCRDGDTKLAHEYAQSAPSAFYDEGLAYTYTQWLVAIYDRNYARALRVLDKSAEDLIFDGDLRNASFGPKVLYYARTHRLAGNYEKAREEFLDVVHLVEKQMSDGVADDFRTAAGHYLALAESQAGVGQSAQALKTVRRARTQVAESGDDVLSSALQIATVIRVLAPAGLATEAINELDDYLGRKAGHWSIEGIRVDPRIESILDHPEYAVLEAKYSRR